MKKRLQHLLGANSSAGIGFIMIGLLLLAFALRVYHLDFQSLWRDEVDAIRFSNWSLIDLIQGLTRRGHNGPLYFFVLRGWRTLTGDSEFALRYFSVLGGVLMTALTYRVGCRFNIGKIQATIAALLVTTSPYLHWYSQEAKMYTWLSSLVLIAIYAYQTALKTDINTSPLPQKNILWWAIFVVASSLSFYVHILAPLMLAVYLVWAIIQWPQLKKQLVPWSIAIALLILPYLPLIWWQFPLFLSGTDSGHPFYSLGSQTSFLLDFYSGGILISNYSLALKIGTSFFVLVGLLLPLVWQKVSHYRKWVTLLSIWLILPTLSVYFISLRVPVFEDRYLIYIISAYYLLMAVGISVFAAQQSWAGALAILFFVGFNLWGIQRQSTNLLKADFRGAAAYIAEGSPLMPGAAIKHTSFPNTTKQYLPLIMHPANNYNPAIMFQMPYLQYTFDYYYPEIFRPLDGVWTNDNRDYDSVDQEMRSRTAGIKTLWLVTAEEDYWDQRHLTRQWLSENATQLDFQEFAMVSVYKYDLTRQE